MRVGVRSRARAGGPGLVRAEATVDDAPEGAAAELAGERALAAVGRGVERDAPRQRAVGGAEDDVGRAGRDRTVVAASGVVRSGSGCPTEIRLTAAAVAASPRTPVRASTAAGLRQRGRRAGRAGDEPRAAGEAGASPSAAGRPGDERPGVFPPRGLDELRAERVLGGAGRIAHDVSRESRRLGNCRASARRPRETRARAVGSETSIAAAISS